MVSPLPCDTSRLSTEAEKFAVRAVFMLVEADHAGMRELSPTRPRPARAPRHSAFPLAEAAKAHALGDTGRTVGKLVRTVP
ncbi:zinc-binding dehydrogenase [Nocardia sp. NPDC050793]|uniref:zinc-binding dehydrogenase n=1 Tax=Nocardia sp. NPDC050793 TaxID=3155159 RepID=UPI0033E2E7E6